MGEEQNGRRRGEEEQSRAEGEENGKKLNEANCRRPRRRHMI